MVNNEIITEEKLKDLALLRNKTKLAYENARKEANAALQFSNGELGLQNSAVLNTANPYKEQYEKANSAYNDAYNKYISQNKATTQDIADYYIELEKNMASQQKPTESPLTPPETMAGNTPSPSTNYYDALMKNREKAFQNARNKAMDNAKLAYQRAVNPYGVVAEGMANAGLSSKGGYGQRVSVNAYNNYANAIANAENTYQQSMDEAELQVAQQKWEEEQTEKARAYQEKLLQMQNDEAKKQAEEANKYNNYANVLDQYINKKGKWEGTSKAQAIAQLKAMYPNATDADIDYAIKLVEKSYQ